MILRKIASKSSAILIAAALLFLGVAVGMEAFGKRGSEERYYEPSDKSYGSVLIDLNSATEEDLRKVEGIGKATAGAIVKYREENGSFTCVEELINVYGIGEKTLRDIAPYVTVTDSE